MRMDLDINWRQWVIGIAWDYDYAWLIVGPLTFCLIKN